MTMMMMMIMSCSFVFSLDLDDDVASPSDSDATSHEESMERLIGSGSVTSDIEQLDADTSSAREGRHHLTTTMFTKIQHNNSSPVKLDVVDEMKSETFT